MNVTVVATENTDKDKEKESNISLNTDVTEDVTPKCLYLIYTMSSEKSREGLIKELSTFLHMAAGKSENSQTLIAMRELLQLAAECCNDSGLFYKFMNVISYTRWGSAQKSGDFFKSKSDVETLSTELEPLRDTLIPTLYLYTYDPLQVPRTYFSIIWEFLTKSMQKSQLLLKYLPQIMNQITLSLDDSNWRRRESACAALSAVLGLGTFAFKERVAMIGELFESCFRVYDDMKESVRLKAEITLKSLFKLTNELTSSLVVGQQTSEKTLKSILPIIIDKGLGNPAADVRKLCLKSIIEITDNAGAAIREHIPKLAICYLEAMSSFESQTLNYLSVRHEGDSKIHETIDLARIS